MQPAGLNNYSSVSRRPLDVEDYFDIVRRHKAWLFGPAFAATVIAVVVAYMWPDTYVSTAVIRVVPPVVPEKLIASNVNTELSQRVNGIYQIIVSRATLTNIITQYNLYKSERESKPIDDVVEQMRKDIRLGDIIPVAPGPRNRGHIAAFSISFSYSNRLSAQAVTNELVSRFTAENQKQLTSQSNQTTLFLKDQLESAKRDVDAIESRLSKFRQENAGKLPEQIQSNQVQLSAAEQRITNLNAQITRAAQEKVSLESDLRSLKNQKASLVPAPEQQITQQQAQAQNQELAGVERRIQALQAMVESLRERYSDKYPDVQRVQAELNAQIRIRDKIATRDHDKEPNAAPIVRPRPTFDAEFEKESRRLDAAVEKLQSQISAMDSEIANYKAALAQAEKQVNYFHGLISSAPLSLQQYADVVRDRELAKAHYDDLNRRQMSSATSEELLKRNQGETLELLDPASLPTDPTKPRRAIIIGGGLVVGLILGAFMAGAREAKDTSLKNLKDVGAYTKLTILGSVPLLENDFVVRRRRRMSLLAWATACLAGILVMTGSVFYYYVTKV